jgi:hypothetical protein
LIHGSCLAGSEAYLYPGEQMVNAAGYPALIKFVKGKPNMPLVVFVPGDSHLARIAYGYPGGNPKDFLDYWLGQQGYSFLAISYPLDNPVYSKTYPNYAIIDWGKQVAEIAKQFIVKNRLSKHIIVVAWSMGGSIVEAFNTAAQRNGLEVDLFVGLSAVPPIPYIMQSGPYEAKNMSTDGLVNREAIFSLFTLLLQEQEKYNHHEIIPNKIYRTQFLGNIPIDLLASGKRYINNGFKNNIAETLKDSGAFLFSNYPWIAVIRDDSPSAAKIILIDPASWNFIRAEMVYHNYLIKKDLTRLSRTQWRQLMTLIDNLPQNLTLTIHGNHFFFLGEKGARETAQGINILASRVSKITQWLRERHF